MQWHKLITSMFLSGALLAPALAQQGGQETVPNGPYGDNDSLASLRSYEQLLSALESSVRTSQGAASLHYAHWTSNSGRKVPYVVVGSGATTVMIIAQQHGDEMETSDSAVNLVRTLANGSMESRTIRAALRSSSCPASMSMASTARSPTGAR
jgi:hypothetical protein